MVHGDRALLFEAIGNLLSNAIKFTPAQGLVVLAATAENGATRLDISDSGPGIAPEEREAIFQRFYRCEADSQHSGFGLGLSIVAAVVKLHGFTLEVGSSEQGGTRMTLWCRQSKALV
jgi:signal transduction histidine kinase